MQFMLTILCHYHYNELTAKCQIFKLREDQAVDRWSKRLYTAESPCGPFNEWLLKQWFSWFEKCKIEKRRVKLEPVSPSKFGGSCDQRDLASNLLTYYQLQLGAFNPTDR